LRRVDDGCELRDTVHSKVGYGECTTLIFLGLELTLSGFGSEGFGLGGDRGEALGSDVFDDGGD